MFDTPQALPAGELASVVVTTADGRVFDLGKPSSRLFGLRVQIYKIRRKLHG